MEQVQEESPLKKEGEFFTGLTKISDTVYRKLAGLLAMEVKGVAGMSTTFSEGISEWVGIKNEYEGVRIKWRPDKTLSVELYVIFAYGYRIPDVALRLQEYVKSGMEKYTGVTMGEINIFAQGVDFSPRTPVGGPRKKDEEISHGE